MIRGPDNFHDGQKPAGADIPRSKGAREPSMQELLTRLTTATGIPVDAITGDARGSRSVAYCRQVFYWLCWTQTSHSLSEIARFVGRADHSTVLKGARRVAENLLFWRPIIDKIIDLER